MNLEGYNKKDATHNLSCSHAFNLKSRYDYWMDCITIKEMSNGRLKILVFGERYWPKYDYKKRIRYVDKIRVTLKCRRRNKIARPCTDTVK